MCCTAFKKVLGGGNECYTNATSAHEKGRNFRFEIRNRTPNQSFCRIKLDGCVMKSSEGQRCDNVFVRCINNNTHEVYFVELKKGSNISKAYEQIVESIKLFHSKKTPINKEVIVGVIVYHGTPLTSQKSKLLKIEFRKKHGKELHTLSGALSIE